MFIAENFKYHKKSNLRSFLYITLNLIISKSTVKELKFKHTRMIRETCIDYDGDDLRVCTNSGTDCAFENH